MRTLRVVGIGVAVLGLPIVAVIAYGSWVNAHMIYPSPENESAFLRSYDSKAVVQPFMALEGYSEGRESGGGAGTKFVTHSAGFDEYFTMRTDQRGSLMVALNYDVSQRLFLSRVRILNESGTGSSGFHFQYATGNTIGDLSIRPLAPGAVHRNMPLAPGLEDVAVNIDVREQWFPKGIPPGVARLLPESESER